MMPEGFLDIGAEAGVEADDDLLGGISGKDGKGVPVALAEVVIFLNGELYGCEGNVPNPVQAEHPDVLSEAGVTFHVEGAVLEEEVIGIKFFFLGIFRRWLLIDENDAAVFGNSRAELFENVFSAAETFPEDQIVKERNGGLPHGIGKIGDQLAGGVEGFEAEGVVSRGRQLPDGHQQRQAFAQSEVFDGEKGIMRNDEATAAAIPAELEAEFRKSRFVLVKLRPADPVGFEELLHGQIGRAFDVRDESNEPMGLS